MKSLKMIGAAIALFAAATMFAGNVMAQSVTAVTTNRSVVITTGNTFQAVLAASLTRRSLTIQNNNASDNCWLKFGVGVTAANATIGTSILLLPGQAFTRYFPYVPSDEIEGTCASNSDTLYVDTQ